MRLSIVCALLALLVIAQAATRGVHPSQDAMYSGDLKCDDKVVPHDKINDEFCDCERDGLDEPGTSACKNARFYCRNEGFRGQFIFTSNVNDGICDCCDGSDEFSSGAKCPNTCSELGETLRKQYMGDAAEIEAGLKAREAMIATAQTELAEKQNKLNSFKTEVEAQQAVVERLRVAKEQAELVERSEREAREQIEKAEREAREAAQAADALKAMPETAIPPLSVEHGSTDQPQQGDGQAPAQPSTEEAPAMSMPETPQQEAAPSEAAFPYPKEYMAPPTGEPTPADAPAAADSASAFPYPAEYAPQPAAAEEQPSAEQPAEVFEDDTPMTPPETSTQEPASKVAADTARSEFNSAESTLNSIKSQMRELETYSNMDFGPDRALASLYKQCVSTQIRQYTYEVCFFDKASQKEGGSSTSLGTWSSWRENEQHREMRFEGGQTCWNGPARSAQVTLRCGASDGAIARILSVEEPSKCVYSMVVATPAACLPSSLDEVQHKLTAAFAEDVRPKGHALKDEL